MGTLLHLSCCPPAAASLVAQQPRRRRQAGPSLGVRAGGDNGSAGREEEEQAKRALKELDQQLSQLSSPNGRSGPNVTKPKPQPQPLRVLPGSEVRKEDAKFEFPELTDSFLAYSAAFLVLLTIVNNLVFNFVFKPEASPKNPLFPDDTVTASVDEAPRPRFKLRSLQQEAESPPSPVLGSTSPQ